MTISPEDMNSLIKNMPVPDRSIVLLKAAYDLLKRCNESQYVVGPFSETVFYDDAECDGMCLANDIANHLGLDELD